MFVCSHGAKKPPKHTRKEHTRMGENKLLTIYGARLSKSKKHITLTLVEGEGDKKQFFTACVKLDEDAKTHGSIDGDNAIVVVPLLKPNKADEDVNEDYEDGVPF